jgi:hypothetical protein
MRQPLALVFYENLLPGNQLLNRLQDLGYRVRTVDELTRLPEVAAQEKPLVVFLELGDQAQAVCTAIRKVKAGGDTQHIPVFAWLGNAERRLREGAGRSAQAAGAAVLTPGPGMLNQLPQLLDQALELY